MRFRTRMCVGFSQACFYFYFYHCFLKCLFSLSVFFFFSCSGEFQLLIMSIELNSIELGVYVCVYFELSEYVCGRTKLVNPSSIQIRFNTFTAHLNFGHKWKTIKCFIRHTQIHRNTVGYLLKCQLLMEIATHVTLAFNWLYKSVINNCVKMNIQNVVVINKWNELMVYDTIYGCNVHLYDVQHVFRSCFGMEKLSIYRAIDGKRIDNIFHNVVNMFIHPAFSRWYIW